MRLSLHAGMLAIALFAGAGCKSNTDRTAADNTARNDRDQSSAKVSEKTADQAVKSDGDLEMTQRIRQAIVADDSLSMNAKNVKIIVQDQVVTLRGPVASAEERAAIERIATNAAGSRRVVNELELAP